MRSSIYIATILSCIILGAAILPAQSAVSVFGTGVGRGYAESCYQNAEFTGDSRDGIDTCTLALQDGTLSTGDRASTLINRGILLARDGSTQAAIDDYNHGLALAPDIGEGYVDRGASEIVLNQFDLALRDINKGIALHSNKIEIAYYDRALIDEHNSDIRAAYEDYKMAVQLAPDFALASDQLSRFKVVRKSGTGT